MYFLGIVNNYTFQFEISNVVKSCGPHVVYCVYKHPMGRPSSYSGYTWST